ncbi:ABC transporter substrate-binding protein [Desulfonema magnum]|nr:ABC transporter substrate binding protein [Desulfonema magnum]
MSDLGLKIYVQLLIWFILIVLSSVSEGEARDTYALIKSKSTSQTEETATGFFMEFTDTSECPLALNKVNPHAVAEFGTEFTDARLCILDVDGKIDAEKIRQFLKKEKPSVIICLGALAAETTLQVEKKIPVIFAMVINHKGYPALSGKNVTGISMEIPPASLFVQFRMLAGQVRSLGVPFHPDVSGRIVEEASVSAENMGMRLIKIPVSRPDRISTELSKYENRYDGLWMLGDTRIYNTRTRAFFDLVEFSKKKRKPLLAFSEAFLSAGAFFSASVNYRSLGSQLAMIARLIVEDRVPPSDITIRSPVGTYTVINRHAARSLFGIKLDKNIYESVDKVYPE